MRKCSKCQEIKELCDFHNDKAQSSGKDYACKKCKSIHGKQKRLENPEKYREQVRRSASKNYETIRASQKSHRERNRERILARRKELREPRRIEVNARESERRKLKRKNDPRFVEMERMRQRQYYEKNREKMLPQHYAHKLVMYAVKLGMLKRPTECEVCKGNIKIEGHHDDYSKPLDVRWLCKSCHWKADRGLLDAESIPSKRSPNT